jgi:acyl-CoA thioesterase-1
VTRDVRVCFLGDSFTQGIGDPEQRGWVGRVLQSTTAEGRAVTGFNLGIRRNTSEDIVRRCWDEVARRTAPDAENRLVLCFGSNDAVEEDVGVRVDPSRTLDNLTALLADSERRAIPALVVGPPPVADAGPAHLQRLLKLSEGMAAVCDEWRAIFVDVTQALAEDRTWTEEAIARDGAHPGAGGYAKMAELVVGGWRRWLPDPLQRPHVRRSRSRRG